MPHSDLQQKDILQYILPSEFLTYFDLVHIEDINGSLHLFLDESPTVPAEYSSLELSPNGFYQESQINDFPLRDRKVVLRVRRRRWKDAQGKSYSRSWDFTEEGTRYSKEFAAFLKEALGFLPDSGKHP